MSDPYFSQVSALLHFDGANTSTLFKDDSPVALIYTVVGNAQLSTANKLYGTAGGSFLGGNSHNVATGIDGGIVITGGPFDFGTSDWTIEMWVYPLDWSVQTPILWTVANLVNSLGHRGYIDQFGKPSYQNINGSINVTSSQTAPLNTWTHVAWVRNGTVMTIYVGGIRTDSVNAIPGGFSIPWFGAGSRITVGYDHDLSGIQSSYFNGYIDEFRITNGLARYTANFTPPTGPFPGAPAVPLTAKFVPALAKLPVVFSDLKGALPRVFPVADPNIARIKP